jgi:hypothetical protein
MFARYTAAILTAASVALAAPARGQTTFTAFLNGAQEVPSRVTSAVGSGSVVLNAARTQIVVNLQYFGLTAPMTVAHIHEAAFGVNGPVRFDLGALMLPGGINGSLTNAMFAVTSAQATALEAGNMYFNVHTSTFPGGEIRGQITTVPEPASMVLLATGLAGIGLVVRRRRSH